MTVSIPRQRAKPAFTNREALKRMLVHNRNRGMSWREIIREHFHSSLRVKPGTLSRIANSDYEPKSPHIRRALGLPIYVRVLACATCGQMHLNPSKVCPTRNRVNRQIRMSISELPTNILKWKLLNREEMPNAD